MAEAILKRGGFRIFGKVVFGNRFLLVNFGFINRKGRVVTPPNQ